ncbi:MAG TPA: universal stress protein [Hyphomicrobiaceae bacterium]|nr:universal stress protein [Hyphomicrobiaceae bacterium]
MADGTPQKIMLATDLTPVGDRAFDRAVQLAEQWDAELVVCHVVESSAVRPWGMDRRMRNAEIEMDRLVRTSRAQLKMARHTVIGDPADRTLEHARAIKCDFLITGPAHGKVLGDKLLGSTAARIVRRATVPVLAVRRRPEGPYRTVVSAVDFSDASRTAFLRGRELFPSARLTALHAYRVSPSWGGPNADKSIDEVEAAERARVIKEAEQDMAVLIAAAGGTSSAVETALQEGDPETALTSYVESKWPDLVVAGTHGRSGYRQDTIGSMAELLLTILPCDVLAVPTRT